MIAVNAAVRPRLERMVVIADNAELRSAGEVCLPVLSGCLKAAFRCPSIDPR